MENKKEFRKDRNRGERNNRRPVSNGKGGEMLEKQNELMVEGRNAVLEALKSNENIDKLYVQEGLGEGPISQIVAEAKKRNILTVYVPKEKLDMMSETGKHQGAILNLSAISYAEVEDILARAEERGEKPFRW